jgi:hypothetical protein
MASPGHPGYSRLYKKDVRIASPRKLFRDLQAFLDRNEYTHRIEHLNSESDDVDNIAIFKGELLGKKDVARRDRAYLWFGIILLPTILLTNLGTQFIRQSRYTFRTVARICVEGEGILARQSTEGAGQNGTPDMISDAGITFELAAGAARGDYGIWKHTDNKRNLAVLEAERTRLEVELSKYLDLIDRGRPRT